MLDQNCVIAPMSIVTSASFSGGAGLLRGKDLGEFLGIHDRRIEMARRHEQAMLVAVGLLGGEQPLQQVRDSFAARQLLVRVLALGRLR